MIGKKAFAHADSVSYFKVKKAFKVFGMPVGIISAFDEGDRDNLWHQYFSRAPGTSPGHFIAVIIDWPKDKIKKYIIEKEIIRLDIEKALYLPFDYEKGKIQIRCLGGFYREDPDIFQYLE